MILDPFASFAASSTCDGVFFRDSLFGRRTVAGAALLRFAPRIFW